MKYRINVVGHQLKGKIIAKGGDVVDESQLQGNAAELLRQGFIVEHDEEPVDEKQADEQKELSDYSKNELLAFATSEGFDVNPAQSKAKLVEEIQEKMDARDNETND